MIELAGRSVPLVGVEAPVRVIHAGAVFTTCYLCVGSQFVQKSPVARLTPFLWRNAHVL
jgi:hypothetical protein